MKSMLRLIILLCLSLTAQAQFPVSVSNTPQMTPFQLSREGIGIKASFGPITTSLASNTVSFGTTIFGASTLTLKPGRAAFITSIQASCATGPVQAFGSSGIKAKQFTPAILGESFSGIDAVFGVNGGSVTVQPMIVLGSEANLDIQFKWIGANNSPYPYCSSSIHFIDITADFHYEAKNVVMVVGESTSWQAMETDPSGVNYPGEALYPFRLTDSLRSERKSFRLINKAFGSASSNDVEYARRSQFYDVDYDLMIVNLSINDANAATSQAVYQANLKNLIIHRNKHRPGASILFVGCPPTDVNVSNYRTWMQAVANDATLGGTTNRVYWVDASTAFTLNATPSADLNFAVSNRSTGNRIHPSGAGHWLIAKAIYPAIKTTDAYINAKK